MLVGASNAVAAAPPSTAELREVLNRLDGRTRALERQSADLQGRLAKAEGKLPNQTKTFAYGLVSGIVAVLFGVGSKSAIDARTARADRRRRESALIAACGAELHHVKESAQANARTVQRELAALGERGDSVTLDERSELVAPLLRMQLPVLARLLEEPPRGMTADGMLLTNTTTLLVRADYANDLSRTRDAYKLMPDTDVEGLRDVALLLERHLPAVVATVEAVTRGVAALEPRE